MLAIAALVVSLCGSALAGTPAKVKKLIDGRTIAPRSQPANRILKDGLTGKQIDEASLGTVKAVKRAETATTATNATTADTAASATNATSVGGETAADLKVRCRPGTTLISGGCVETGAARTADAYQDANFLCGVRTLPTVPQLLALHAAQPAIAGVEMTGTILISGTEFTVDMGTGAIGTATTATSLAFRCVAAPTNF